MVVEKRVIAESMAIELAVPDGGFSKDFVSSLTEICAGYSFLDEGYVLLKRSGGEVSLFLCFMCKSGFGADEIDTALGRLTEDVVSLFSESMAIEVVCLNGQQKLTEAVRKTAAPFFRELKN